MPIPEWTVWLSAAKTTLDIFKSVRSELPQGIKSEEAQKQIEKAELALKSSEAQLAKALGYVLCRCTFPPQAMLWNKDRQVNVCPECGDIWPRPPEVRKMPEFEPDWIRARRGR